MKIRIEKIISAREVTILDQVTKFVMFCIHCCQSQCEPRFLEIPLNGRLRI